MWVSPDRSRDPIARFVVSSSLQSGRGRRSARDEPGATWTLHGRRRPPRLARTPVTALAVSEPVRSVPKPASDASPRTENSRTTPAAWRTPSAIRPCVPPPVGASAKALTLTQVSLCLAAPPPCNHRSPPSLPRRSHPRRSTARGKHGVHRALTAHPFPSTGRYHRKGVLFGIAPRNLGLTNCTPSRIPETNSTRPHVPSAGTTGAKTQLAATGSNPVPVKSVLLS
jgi:hypothetical protein